MKYVCSKKYKILCRENCYHVKNIKEENRVWFNSVEEGTAFGCRPCKHCKPESEFSDNDL
jgi:methylphosphotriester-DNA--protein-cysteine methyltransferase